MPLFISRSRRNLTDGCCHFLWLLNKSRLCDHVQFGAVTPWAAPDPTLLCETLGTMLQCAATLLSPPSSLQARSKHRPLSGQRAAALLSLAKQLRAAAASTAVTCVKRAFSLTHKRTRAGGLATACARPQCRRVGLAPLHMDKKGTG